MVYPHGFVLNYIVLAMFGRIVKFILNIPQLRRQKVTNQFANPQEECLSKLF